LLILDNFEQLVKGRSLVVDLLQAAPDLKILVTSREALHLYGEHQFIVPELTLPDPDHLPPLEALNEWPAVALFVQRVQARHPAFALTDDNKKLIVRLCHRLDGLPLAIELAAAQVRLFSPGQPLPQLEHGLKFLKDTSTDRPSRQQTLWNAIDWSYQLLSEAEKTIFRRLSVFGREWSISAAQSVCQVEDLAESLEELTDKNLLRYVGPDETGHARFQMLQPVREYAFEQLDIHAEAEQTQRRHARYFMEMAQNAEPAIATPEQSKWIYCIKLERENLQIALQWMLDRQEIEMAFTLLGAVWRYYNMLNIWDETQAWMERALAQGAHVKTVGRVKTLWGLYWLCNRENNHQKSLALAEEGLSIARDLQDPRLIGLLLQCMVGELNYYNKQDEALQALEESWLIFQELGDKAETAWVLGHISSFFAHQGNLVKAQEFLQESLSIFREIGDDWATPRILRDLALLYWQQDNLEPIKDMLEESLLLSEKTGERMGIAWTLNMQGRLAVRQSNLTLARTLFEKAQGIFRELGDPHSLSYNQACMDELTTLENKK
jgi:predicted ATPase